jgi:MAF protein
MSANVDESSITEPNPAINVVKTAELKAQTIAAQIQPPTSPTIIVAADTTVALDNKMLGKPRDAAEAKHMLLALCARTHAVHTGMVLLDMRSGKMVEEVHTAVVTMRPYTDKEIIDYIATNDPLDKAGAYAIQHCQFRPVSDLKGCYLGVMGLSICHLNQMLIKLNIVPPIDHTYLKKAHQTFPCPIQTT